MRRPLIALAVATAAVAIAGARAYASDPPVVAHAAAPPAAAEGPKEAPAVKAAAKPGTPAPARVDEVMSRVRSLIAAYEKDVLPESGTAAAPRPRRAAPSRSVEPAGTPRVALVWRATLVWPEELQ
jgi:hypothetical protein